MYSTDKDFFAHLQESVRKALEKEGFTRRMDLLLHFPLRYEDWRHPVAVADLKIGEAALVEGEIVDVKPAAGGRQLLVGLADNAGDCVLLRFFHRNKILDSSMRLGRKLRAFGTISRKSMALEMAHPKLQSAHQPGQNTAVYPALGKITGATMQKIVTAALQSENFSETVNANFRRFRGGELTFSAAVELLHHSDSAEHLKNQDHPAWRRLRFDELLAHQIALRARRYRADKQLTPAILPAVGWQKPLIDKLPFSLTKAQQRAIKEVCSDLATTRPMRRLLQGDVGSGKTAVAAFACLAAASCGKISAFMAPTGILANQHYERLSEWLGACDIRCELFTANIKGNKRKAAIERLRLGVSHVAIGTHTLFQETLNLPAAALVVIDEQQRFGVEQRQAVAGGGCMHRLMMSATPIPRTLAMSVFADLDVSILDEKPDGRAPVNTLLISDEREDEVLARLAERTDNCGRAFWICPRVSDSQAQDLHNAETTAATAKQKHPALNPHLLHGRMTAAKKAAVMESFRDGEIGLLVATTVVEVGVDVPQADVMVISNPERMGLSQLHQLRGRIGRGDKPGVCILLYPCKLSETALSRLKALRENDDGFAIAQIDLSIRGPGEWLSVRQSGLPMMRVAKLPEDKDIAVAAAAAAEWMLKNDKRACVRHAGRWLGEVTFKRQRKNA